MQFVVFGKRTHLYQWLWVLSSVLSSFYSERKLMELGPCRIFSEQRKHKIVLFWPTKCVLFYSCTYGIQVTCFTCSQTHLPALCLLLLALTGTLAHQATGILTVSWHRSVLLLSQATTHCTRAPAALKQQWHSVSAVGKFDSFHQTWFQTQQHHTFCPLRTQRSCTLTPETSHSFLLHFFVEVPKVLFVVSHVRTLHWSQIKSFTDHLFPTCEWLYHFVLSLVSFNDPKLTIAWEKTVTPDRQSVNNKIKPSTQDLALPELNHCIVVILSSTTISKNVQFLDSRWHALVNEVLKTTQHLIHSMFRFSFGSRVHLSLPHLGRMDSKHKKPQLPWIEYITCWYIWKWYVLLEVKAQHVCVLCILCKSPVQLHLCVEHCRFLFVD